MSKSVARAFRVEMDYRNLSHDTIGLSTYIALRTRASSAVERAIGVNVLPHVHDAAYRKAREIL